MNAREIDTDCCVVGGGPAGVMAGLLFARAGVRTTVLEKHGDFLRDFRGDTVHPSTMEVMHELGLLEAFLKRPHARLARIGGVFSGHALPLTDFSSLPVHAKFIALMPQWHFLDFLVEAAAPLPGFDLHMNAEGRELVHEDGRVAGVRAEIGGEPVTIRSKLVIGADGRHSTMREQAGLERIDIGAPIDVLWFRVPREGGKSDEEPLFYAGDGHAVVAINRDDYFQCAFIIEKGGADRVRANGIEAFREAVERTVPRLNGATSAVQSFDDVKLLTVAMDRLKSWSQPGLLMIGDSAHAMSPVGGVGINLAIQDAVAAANLFARPLAEGTLADRDLDLLRQRREWPVRATQFLQTRIQDNIVTPIIAGRPDAGRVPLPIRVVSRVSWLQRLAARVIGIGVRPEHVKSPQLHALDTNA